MVKCDNCQKGRPKFWTLQGKFCDLACSIMYSSTKKGKKKGRKEWVTLPDGRRVFTETFPVDEKVQREFGEVLSPIKQRGRGR